MRKKLIKTVSMLLSLGVVSVLAPRTAYSAYSGGSAASYALNYVNVPNPNYSYFNNADCTNFVSQCVYVGGKDTVPVSSYASLDGWAPYSATWANAEYFRRYWKNTRGINVYNTEINTSNNTLNAYIYQNYWGGDVVQYHSTGDSQHSQMVVGQTTYNGHPTLRVAQHSDNALYPLSYYFTITGCSHVRVFRFHPYK